VNNHELHQTAVAYRTDTDRGDLELPVNPEFVSLPPKLTPDQYVAWCEEHLRQPLTRLVSPPEDPLLPRPEFDL
jgi:hypothetical protein